MGNGKPNLSSLLPGGDKPGAVETHAGLILLGALAFLVVIRRSFRSVLGR